ncbi:MAG: apolipoprotein N-acyltransferase [Alphaproteobacteria bacterium]|nr:apolipoprotein N-acyltransferase [Alphaproteobacteria bacterium]
MTAAARIIGALLTAVSLPFISAPANLHWLHWVAFLPLFAALSGLSLKRGVLLSYFTGWVSNFIIFWWLIETVQRFSSLPWVVALLVHILATTVFSLSYGMFGLMPWLRARLGGWWMLAFPITIVASEQAFPVLFPYYQGVSQYRVAPMIQLASVTGIMGISFLVVLVNCVLFESLDRLRRKQRPPLAALGATAAVMAATVGFGVWRHGAVEAELAKAPELQVTILQQNVTMEERLRQSGWEGYFEWLRLTSRVAGDRPDLVVWPEGAIPFNPHEERPFSTLRSGSQRRLLGRLMQSGGYNLMSWPEYEGVLSPNNETLVAALSEKSVRSTFEEIAQNGGFDLLIGGGTIEMGPGPEDFTAHNSLYVFDETGTIEARYDKMVPLPFGEYIPLSDTFPFLKEIVQGPGDFQAGDHPVFFEVANAAGDTLRYTTPICYEAILNPTMRKLAGGDSPETTADFFVNITNDAWFGNTASPHQHAMLTAVQTVQVGRPMLRIAYTGISWVVDPHGDIHYETTPFTEEAHVVPMRVAHVPTVYERGGWIFGWLCTAGFIGIVIVARRRVPTLG